MHVSISDSSQVDDQVLSSQREDMCGCTTCAPLHHMCSLACKTDGAASTWGNQANKHMSKC